MSGMDVRQLGRIRRALEDSLVDYIIENIDSRLDIIKIQDNIIYISWSKYHPKLK